jgi:hypothetical protein
MAAAIKKYAVAALAISGALAGSSKKLIQCSKKQEQGVLKLDLNSIALFMIEANFAYLELVQVQILFRHGARTPFHDYLTRQIFGKLI